MTWLRQLCSVRRVIEIRHPSSSYRWIDIWGSSQQSTVHSTESAILFSCLPSDASSSKIACITYEAVRSSTQPAYLHSVLKHYVPSRTMRSSDSDLLFVPHVRTHVLVLVVLLLLLPSFGHLQCSFHILVSSPTENTFMPSPYVVWPEALCFCLYISCVCPCTHTSHTLLTWEVLLSTHQSEL